jgi:hypothetical protein
MFAHRQSQDAVAFACRLITRGLFEPTAASPWQAILNLLSDLKACCDSVVVVDRLLDAFDATMAAAATTLATESAPGLAFQIVSPAFLELWLDYAQKSQHFLNAIKAIPYEQLGDFHALPPAVQDLLTKGVTIKSRIDISQFPILPFETFCKMFAKGIFAEIATVRSNLLNLTCELFPAPPSELITFINYSVLLEDLAPPPAFPECPLAQSLLTLFPAALDRLRSNRPIFEEFFQLIEAIFFVAPRSVSVLAPDLVAAFTLSAVDAPHVPALFSILHHLMVFDHTFLESLTPGVVAKIATVPAGSRTGIHMAFLLQGAADESVLVGACVEFALGSVFDENADLLLRMIEGGLRPGPFTVPRVLSDPLALRIANALWRAVPDLHDRLTPPMRAALRMAKPADVFRLSSCVQDAVRYVGLPR